MTTKTSEMENINLNVKVPKKRGRKTKLLSLDKMLDSQTDNCTPEPIKVHKKRGRKPKTVKNDDKEVKIPKKRGRKPMLSTSVINNKNISENFITKDNVLHLNINSKEAENNIMLDSLYQYNPEINEPSPYDPVDNYAITLENLENTLKSKYDNHNYSMDKKKNQQFLINNDNTDLLESIETIPENKKQKLNNENYEEQDKFKSIPISTALRTDLNSNIEQTENMIDYREILENQDNQNKEEEILVPISKSIKNTNYKKINSIMVYYNEYNKRKEWPKKSSINCFWCCHTFTCPPCVLPTKLKGDVFHVYGNFCSKECAAAYNFESQDNNNYHCPWERYSLLNHLYSIISEKPDLLINLAPHRMTLEMFGGSLSIEEFRESFSSNKKYNIVYPPMVSIIPALEVNNKVDTSKRNDSYYIPIDKERIKKVNNDLRLRRRNPINNKNTLENCMRLKYS